MSRNLAYPIVNIPVLDSILSLKGKTNTIVRKPTTNKIVNSDIPNVSIESLDFVSGASWEFMSGDDVETVG